MKATIDFQIDPPQKKNFTHDWLNFVLVFVNVIAYIVLIFFNAASSIPQLGFSNQADD